MGNNRGTSESAYEAKHKRWLEETTEIAKNQGLYGARVIASSLRYVGECIKDTANAPKELLSEQYEVIAVSLLESTIVNYWERLAQGCQTDGKEDLCKYFRQEGQAPCIDPHSKFKCPVYLATGSPMCANRPFLATVQGLTCITTDKCQAIEFQIEFLVHLLFTINPSHPKNQYVRDTSVLQNISVKWGGLNLDGPMFLESVEDLCFIGCSGSGFSPQDQIKAVWDNLSGYEKWWANQAYSETPCNHSEWFEIELAGNKLVHQCADCYHHVQAKGKKSNIYGG